MCGTAPSSLNIEWERSFGTAEVLGIGFSRNIRGFLRSLVDRIFDLNIRAMRMQDTYTTERKARQPSPDRPGGVNFGWKKRTISLLDPVDLTAYGKW